MRTDQLVLKKILSVILVFQLFNAAFAQTKIRREIIYDVDFNDSSQFMPFKKIGGSNQFISLVFDKIIAGDIAAYIIGNNYSQNLKANTIQENLIKAEHFEKIDPQLLAHYINDRYYMTLKGWSKNAGESLYNAIMDQHTVAFRKKFENVFFEPLSIQSKEVYTEDGILVYTKEGAIKYKHDTLPLKRYNFNQQTISFHEVWVFDTVATSLKKETKGLILHLNKDNPHALYVPFAKKEFNSDKKRMDADIITKVPIKNEKNGIYHHLDTTMRYSLYSELMELDSTVLPEVKLVGNKSENCLHEIKIKGTYDERTNENGTVMYNADGTVKLYYTGDIINFEKGKSITFLEEWYFDWNQFAIQKKVKGFISGQCFYPLNQ